MLEMKNIRLVLFFMICVVLGLCYAQKLNANSQIHDSIDLSNQRKPGKVKTYLKSPLRLIAESQECRDDVLRVCGSTKFNPSNNFDVLLCLTNSQDNSQLSRGCNQYLWHYKMNVTQGSKFGRIAKDVCRQAIIDLTICETFVDKPDGKLVSCLLDNKGNITAAACVSFLTKIRTIIFSDFHLICDFAESCKADIVKHKCEGLNSAEEQEVFSHSQGSVVACLEDKLSNDEHALDAACFTQIIRIAELSAEDYHLDRALYFKCRADRETFCAGVVAGQGKVYECLFKHKFDQRMSHKCRDALTTRQKVQALDFKASYPLIRKCKADMKRRRCKMGEADPGSPDMLISLSSVMLCLKKKDSVPLSPACDEELLVFREMLMEDYELSPEITHHCGVVIQKNCELNKQGRTIHCLMGLAQSQRLPELCQQALMNLMEETGVMTDYRLDPVLATACQLAITTKCSADNSDDSTVLSCLMDHIHDKDVKKKCRKALIELQYFISRDFSIDPAFNNACREDIKSCQVSTKDNGEFSIPFSMVLSCLYRNIRPPIGEEFPPLSAACEDEVRRVIKQRALNVHLNPALEENCRQDLGLLCSGDDIDDNSEFQCLQDMYENITIEECRSAVKELTEMESRNMQDFDSILVKECAPMLKQFCQDLVDAGDEGKVVECLIAHKDEMQSKKCAAGVTHFQLVEMKDYHFNYKFLKSCKDDIRAYCGDGKSKPQVVECLSKLVRDDALVGKSPQVSKECRAQLTVEKLQAHENIELNPEMNKKCKSDYKKLCAHVKAGNAAVIDCLRTHQNTISRQCYKYLHNLEKEEVENPKLDFVLMRRCKSDIHERCFDAYQNGEQQQVVDCLIKHKFELLKMCRDVVTEREKEMFSDIELNVDLHTSCEKDIKKYCRESTEKAKEAHLRGESPNGIVYKCLTEIFTEETSKKKLSVSCYRHLEFVIREEERDYRLNPQLLIKCVDSINTLCSSASNVVQCLKEKFLGNKLKDQRCMLEVAQLLREGESDIMADPLLQEACALDLQSHCSHIPEGHGRKVTCLLKVYKQSGSLLDEECSERLLQRQQMWKAVRKEFSGLRDIGVSIMESEHSTYILSMLTFLLLLVLLTGTLCGRITKRVNRDRKMQ